MNEIESSVLIIGGGMAGLTAGAYASQAGHSVIVVERAAQLGGSARLSNGFLWTAKSNDDMRRENPLGRTDLGERIVGDFEPAVDWLRSLDVAVGPRIPVYFGHGHQVDIHGYFRRCLSLIQSNGHFVPNAHVTALTRSREGRVTGARISEQGWIGRIKANATVLSTGGFQGSPRLRAQHIHRNARSMLLRANDQSSGGGLELGTRVGGAVSDFMDGFYGHLVGSPLNRFTDREFSSQAQYGSEFGILVNLVGSRFTDESARDSVNAQAVLRQPRARAWLIVDDSISRRLLSKSHIRGIAPMDRLAAARGAGARYAQVESLMDLTRVLEQWHVDGAATLRTVRRYNTGSFAPDEPGRLANHIPIAKPPYHVLEVQPSITFTYGGVRVDPTGRVVGIDGLPIGGLLAAGADVGGVYDKGYAGGLAMALVLGRLAGSTAVQA